MDESRDTVDEFEIRRIIQAATDMQRDSRTSPELRSQLHWLIELLVADCSEADLQGIGGMVLGIAQTAFAIGAIAGTPAMVTHLRAGKHAAGGVRSGKARQATAATRKAHAVDLMQEIQTSLPGLSQEAMAAEIVNRWKLDVTAPGISAFVKMMRERKRSIRTKNPD